LNKTREVDTLVPDQQPPVPLALPTLSDGQFTLRAWQPRDLAAVEDATRDPYIVATTSVPARYTSEEGRA